MKLAALCCCAVLAGCHAGYGYQWASTATLPPVGSAPTAPAGVSIGVSGNGIAGAILIGVVLADSIRYFLRMPDGTTRPYDGAPDPDPARAVNLQDCTQPIDLKAGNLMCR